VETTDRVAVPTFSAKGYPSTLEATAHIAAVARTND